QEGNSPNKAACPNQQDSCGGAQSLDGGDVACATHRETPTVVSSAASKFEPENAAGYGFVSKDIRFYVDALVHLWDNQPHRKVLIVKELRKAKLVPKHFR